MTKRFLRQTDKLFICSDSRWVTDDRPILPRTSCPGAVACGPTAVKDLPAWAIVELIDEGRATLKVRA